MGLCSAGLRLVGGGLALFRHPTILVLPSCTSSLVGVPKAIFHSSNDFRHRNPFGGWCKVQTKRLIDSDKYHLPNPRLV